ncbi:ankyrin repeat-containing protein, putative [Eimeria maxima]|uniref:Ankyrin repeat-containing protein, putative n=1 Tax=Eimeria maxima TaxID=5804 RepID=U6ME44_EIMMA|nr:ankyrin repeat-containing protein, putative [Eimeria maxima]CDJ60714.1 ankyrin repeat-containing protein, putative [Eimeria maxima]
MATFHLEKSVIASGSLGTVKSMKRYWNQPVSDMDEKSNASKYTLLQMALMLQKKKVVEYLLPQQDLDLNTKATDGTTALMTACDQQVPLDWVQAMLERGARKSINDEDNDGRTALDRCEKGSKLYDLLIKYGATPRPEKPPTPPPEPEQATPAQKPEMPAETGNASTTVSCYFLSGRAVTTQQP